MKAELVIDIGNTNITGAVFEKDAIVAKAKIPTQRYGLYRKGLCRLIRDSGIRTSDISCVLISSVVPLALARTVHAVKTVLSSKIYILGRDIKVPIKNLYDDPSEVGQDRLVNAYAAKMIFGHPVVIIDSGTAMTFDIVSRRGEYLGGLILPGIGISLKGLYEKTALLPFVELERAVGIIGKDTVSSIRGGMLFGYGVMCDGLIKLYKKILGKTLKVVLTGGNAALLAGYAKEIKKIDEDLTLKGLHLIINKHKLIKA